MSLKKKIIILGALFLSLWQTSYAQPPLSETAIQNAVLVHINEYRHKHGLSTLHMNNDMVREAKQHSLDMAHHRMPFGHQGFLKRVERLHRRIKNSGAGAENIAYNYKDAHTVVQQWLLSPGHKRNIDGNYNLTGIGVARDNQGHLYYTQIFLRADDKQHQVSVRRPFFGVSFRRAS
ncbi:MAG: CAP domain-containing protein [Legionella sp.]|uniref:CAP domain-containing protein n=1 Tax=Legionella sp. TaxID=459 RepID=UPI0039E25304